jgi:hypothetical protein
LVVVKVVVSIVDVDVEVVVIVVVDEVVVFDVVDVVKVAIDKFKIDDWTIFSALFSCFAFADLVLFKISNAYTFIMKLV